ncbi:MAG: LmbE family protein [Alphaproteobacteria bacterium]|nr:MAG: LmbE family protein [Alphaproteobacteria bacterium]
MGDDICDTFSGVERVLVLAPHPDDAELGCGGLISLLRERNIEVSICVFSLCEESIPNGFAHDVLAQEFRNSGQTLGVVEKNLIIKKYRVRRFDESRQDILEDIVCLRREIRPDLVLMPSLDDIHQDHGVIAQQALRAIKTTKLMSYELPWNQMKTSLNFFVKLSERHIEAKIKAISCYESQQHRAYTGQFLYNLANVRGVMSGGELAEAFTIEKWVC